MKTLTLLNIAAAHAARVFTHVTAARLITNDSVQRSLQEEFAALQARLLEAVQQGE